MEYRELGATGVDVSAITLGAWAYGKDAWANVSDDESVQAIQAALDAGINMIDTAVGYGGGYSERLIGEAVKGRRDEVLLASKCMVRPEGVRKAVDDCLERMQTDFVDLYQVHYPLPGVPVADTIGAMDEIRCEGKTRFIGVCNFSLDQMQEAVATARVDACQPPFNVFWREIDDGVLPFCREHDIAVLPYSPLAQGLLAGRFRSRGDIPDDVRAHNKLFAEGIFQQCLDVVAFMEGIATRHGKTLAQAAINWTIYTPGITSAIVGARRPSQVRDNIGGVGWRLSDEEMETISRMGLAISRQLDFSTNMWSWKPA